MDKPEIENPHDSFYIAVKLQGYTTNDPIGRFMPRLGLRPTRQAEKPELSLLHRTCLLLLVRCCVATCW